MGLSIQEQYPVLTDYDTTTAYSQAFYTLFANMRFHWEDGQKSTDQRLPAMPQVHTLLLTSASAYKDQATVAVNLAIVAAQSGAETILVDADLRSPGIRQRFGLSPGPGLSDLLEMGETRPQKIIPCLQSTFVPGLRVLGTAAAGPRASALLLSPHLKRVITGICEVLASSEELPGIVIFHGASVVSAVDASLIGALTDQTVLSVIMGQTTRVQATRAWEQLEQAHIKLAGVIVLHP